MGVYSPQIIPDRSQEVVSTTNSKIQGTRCRESLSQLWVTGHKLHSSRKYSHH